jgi:ligand-binding sensor domain-containing protein/signal transduction histidine kinase
MYKGHFGLFVVAAFLAPAGMAVEATLKPPPVQSLANSFFELGPAQGGWPESAVTTIVQSREGYLWLGTYHGLVRFDGVRFTVFNNTPGLANGLITALHEDSRGELWIGHETGHLTRFRSGQFESVTLSNSWPGGVIESISTDQDGDVWLMNDAGLLYRLRDAKTAEAPGGASPTRKVALVRAPNGKIWLVANGVIATLEKGKVVSFPIATPTDFFERVLPTPDGGLWVLGNQRLRKWLGGHWVGELDVGSSPPGNVNLLFATGSGTVLAGTLRDGLLLLRPGSEPIRFDRANGLSHNWVRALCEDSEGNVWIGTGAGLNSLRPRKVQVLQSPDDWQGCAVLSLALDSDGSAWIGTEGAGLYRYDYGEWSYFAGSNDLPNLYVWSVLQTRARQLFVGTWGGGLLVKRGDRFVAEGDLSQITAPVVSLYEGKDGELWIGTTAGLYRYEAGKITWSAGKDKLAFPDIRAITQTSDGTLWFGMTGGGLGRLEDGKIKQFRKADGLGSDFIVCLYAEPDGTLWIGSSDNGLTRLKQGRFAKITSAQGLPSEIICHIVDDGRGNLWMGSHRGILRASRVALDRCADGITHSVSFQSYGKAEGLKSEMCSGGFQPGASVGTDGQLWFPTAKGIGIIDPSKVVPNTNVPPVVIEELWIDNQLVTNLPASTATSTRPLQVAPGKHRFEIHYTGLSFTAPDKVRFRYKLEGLEQDWKDAGTSRLREYSYLPPAAYTFRVTACNNDEVWNETGASLEFVVLPFFWQTLWFQVSFVVAGMGLAGAGALWAGRVRVRRKLEQLERQRALERERARIARDIHDDLGASLTRITMLSQSVRGEVETMPETAADADQIYGTARELTRALDEIVWAVNPKHDTLDSLVTYLGGFAQQFLSAAGIRCRLDVPVNLPAWAITSEVRHNVFLAFKEALHNVLRHAKATEVRVSLELQPDAFELTIADNGCGFDTRVAKLNPAPRPEGARLAAGNGLHNMRKRLEQVGGRCDWDTAPGEGTRVKFLVRVKSQVIKTHDNHFPDNEL